MDNVKLKFMINDDMDVCIRILRVREVEPIKHYDHKDGQYNMQKDLRVHRESYSINNASDPINKKKVHDYDKLYYF
jgi:hypothetical protein